VALSTVVITGSWVTPLNTPATGQVVITPVAPATGGGYIVADSPIVVPLTAGAISQTVVNNTQVATLLYQIVEQITGAPAVTYVIAPTGSTIDLSTVTRLPATVVAPNPNRPLLTVNVDFTQGPPHLPGASAQSINNQANRNVVRKVTISRGRQYELDQVQAGTCTLEVTDPLEMLHPANTASPFNSAGSTITSYRCAQVAAWWNPATQNLAGNLLNTANVGPGGATPYDPSFESTVGWLGLFGTAATIAQSTTHAYDGTHSCAVTLTGTGDVAGGGIWTAPGLTYTLSAYVWVPAGESVTLTFGQFTPAVTVYGSATSTVTGGWQRLFVTAPATNAVSYFTVRGGTGATYPFTFWVDAVQLEFAVTPTTFTAAGPTMFSLYTGYVERFPLQWDMQGTRGIRPLTMVDALSVLSRTEITQAYSTTILADNPYVYIPYNDQSLPQQVRLPQGGQITTGYSNLGTNGQVNFQGDTFLDGTAAVSVTQQNATPPTSGNPVYITYLGTHNGSVSLNPQAFTLELWFRWTSGTIYIGVGDVQPGENVNTESLGPTYQLGVQTLGGKLLTAYQDPNGSSAGNFGFPGITGYPDGQWHYLVLRLTGSSQIQLAADATIGGHGNFGFTPSQAISINNFYVNAGTYFGDPVTTVAVANLAAYPVALTNTQVLAHYNRGAGYIGEVSGARVSRLLTQYWAGPVAVAAGKRQMAPDFDYATRFVLDVLQEIQETERGLVYADRAGTVVFEDSASRYVNNPTSKAVLGENPAGVSPVEYPYSALVQDYDPTYTFSQANLTRPGNSTFAPLPSPLPVNPPYGQRILSQQVQVNTDFDLTQASTFYLKRYGAPVLRVETLTLNPAAQPALWGVVLGLEISQRITVKRRTTAGLVTIGDYYIEQINHTIDDTSWTVDLQCSPVFNANAWVLGNPAYGILGSTTIPVY
jgi:hypothetical protein